MYCLCTVEVRNIFIIQSSLAAHYLGLLKLSEWKDSWSICYVLDVSCWGVFNKWDSTALHTYFSRLYPTLGVVLHVLVTGIVCNSMFTATEGRRKAAPGVYCMHIFVNSENSWKTVSLMVISVTLPSVSEQTSPVWKRPTTDYTLCRRWWRSNEITQSALGIILVFVHSS